MKTLRALFLVGVAVMFASKSVAQNYDTNNVMVQTFAGSGFYGYYDGQGALTMFNSPNAISADSAGNLFVHDSSNARIRKITTNGTVTTFVGGGNTSLPAFGTNAYLPTGYGSEALITDHSNTLWLAVGGALIRISPEALAAYQVTGINSLAGLCVDSANNLYYSSNNRIVRYNPANGQTDIFAGSGNQGAADGNWIFTSFNAPTALAADAANNIYVWDSGNKAVRRINQNRDVETIVGTNNCYYCEADGPGNLAQLSSVNSMAVDNNGNLLLACGLSVRKLNSAATVSTVAGSFSQSGYVNGGGAAARFINARGICVSQGAIFVADVGDHRIRKITFDATPQVVPDANLSLRLLPSLRITGAIGRTYRIESSLNLSNWITETNVFLTSTPYRWLDEGAHGQAKYYRTLLLP